MPSQRNLPCPCGSRLKHKKCCGSVQKIAAAQQRIKQMLSERRRLLEEAEVKSALTNLPVNP